MSNDLRERIIKKHERGINAKEIQRELEIKSLSTVYEIIRLYKTTGEWKPRPLINGAPPKMTRKNLEDLEAAVRAQPDISLEELKEQLELPVSISRICRILNNKLGLGWKKNSFPGKTKPS